MTRTGTLTRQARSIGPASPSPPPLPSSRTTTESEPGGWGNRGTWSRRGVRESGFAEEVLRAYAYQCAMCGFGGALGRTPVGIEAAHVRWHSQNGPDEVANALAL
jgi:predicted restriction endonuclease